MSLNFNIPLVAQWAKDRNLIEGSNPKQQFLKHVEEGGEIFEAILLVDKDKAVDAIGDTCVVITIILIQAGYDPVKFIKNKRNAQTVYPNFKAACMTHEAANLTMKFGMYQGVLARALAKEQNPIPAITDVIDSLRRLSHILCIDFAECYRIAYNEIKDRKGKMVDGVFVKDE